LPDAMHYEFTGTPADAAAYTAKARRYNLGYKTATLPKPIIPLRGDEPMMIVRVDEPTIAFLLSGGKLVRIESQSDKNALAGSGVDIWKITLKQQQTLIKAFGAPVDT
jgi:hypothetical protein